MTNGKHRGQRKQKKKGAYDKSGGITHDTAAFAFRTKDILKIRSRPRLEPGSDYHYLVRDIKRGLIAKVVVYKLDRISRSILDFANMMELLSLIHISEPTRH